MKRILVRSALALLLSSPLLVHADDVVGTYKQFGFKHTNAPAESQSDLFARDSAECDALAARQAEEFRKNAARASSLLGMDMGKADIHGTYFIGCMSDARQGKGWKVYARDGDGWRAVSDRYAARTFMGLDPAK